MAHDLVWVENKRTPIVVEHGKGVSTSSHYHPDSDGSEVRRRKATESEEKTIANGDWVRVNRDDKKPSDSGYKDRKSKVRPQHNALGDVLMFAAAGVSVTNEAVHAAAEDGYEGVTHAGLAIVAVDTGRVLLAQRAPDETDDEDVRETWEFPGGSLEPSEHPYAGALREFREELGRDLTDDVMYDDTEVVNGWRGGDQGQYQAFVLLMPDERVTEGFEPNDEVQAVAWASRQDLESLNLRPEVEQGTDWDKVFGAVSGNQEDDMDDIEPDYDDAAFALDGPIPIHGVVAPEEMSSGDRRAFAKGAMTRRPLRLAFRDQHNDIGGHNGAVTVGSVDRMMRKDGLIHWEGALMNSEVSEPLIERMQFFDGRYGVSVDGDQGSLDEKRSETEATMWFDSVRAAGLTAVAIPAFHEAYVAFGVHPEMPAEETLAASAYETGDLIGDRREEFKRGAGWVTNPRETSRLHRYWTEKGQPGYAKVRWGTPGDFTRAKRLIGEKIAKNSPDKMRYINQIIAQWHFDALGYWPGELGKPGNAPDTAENRRRAARHAASLEASSVDADMEREIVALMTEGLDRDDIVESEETESVWETVLVSSAVSGNSARPPLSYFHQHPSMVEDPFAAESGAMTIEEPDAQGFRRTWGYAAEWGVCHVGMNGRCVEPPQAGSDDYPAFHLGVTRTAEGIVHTGVLTYGIGHRDAETMLSESATQAYFDNIKNAWAAVRVGENERGIWFSGVVLPKVDAGDIVKIEASGQVSGEWLAGEMRACLTVNVPGFPNERPTAAYDSNGNVMALAASAFGGVPDAPCNETDDPIAELAIEVAGRIEASQRMKALADTEAARRFAALRADWEK